MQAEREREGFTSAKKIEEEGTKRKKKKKKRFITLLRKGEYDRIKRNLEEKKKPARI